jgi:hypothetical protein
MERRDRQPSRWQVEIPRGLPQNVCSGVADFGRTPLTETKSCCDATETRDHPITRLDNNGARIT